MMEEFQEVSLQIENQVFKVKKDMLSEHSDYFRAMFSGNYVENEQSFIKIEVIDAASMNIILRYMDIGLIDLTEYDLPTIRDLAMAANFLQITELIKQIQYTLDTRLSTSNWIQTMEIAETASYTNLHQSCEIYGLLSFKQMKPEYIPNIHKLFWYLSHPYLDATCELDVFKFGYQWMYQTATGADALMIIIGCLDINRLKLAEIKEIKIIITDYIDSLAGKVINCFLEMSHKNKFQVHLLTEKKQSLISKFSERVYNEVAILLRESQPRKLKYNAVVPVWMVKNLKLEYVPHHVYTFDENKGFEKWLEVAEKNLWGWSICAWGANKLVVVCGEHGRGTGVFMKDVKVYDTLKKEWIKHGVELPPRRHGGVAVIGDYLYIIGGVGGFRVVLDTAIVYDLRHRTYRKIAKMPDALQNPAVCAHNNAIYAAGHTQIYRYEDLGDTDRWVTVITPDIRINSMISFKDYIYCSQNFFSQLYRFKPDFDNALERVAYNNHPPTAVCNLGNRILFFTRTLCGRDDMLVDVLSVEEFRANGPNDSLKLVWSEFGTDIRINDVAGSCSLVLSIPKLDADTSPYRYLKHYNTL